MVTNPFVHESAAARYAHGRVAYHGLVVERIRDLPGVEGGFGLDVGSGTGMSARALTTLCRHVVALDAAPAMLSRLVPSPTIERVVARAERLPLPDATFDVITVSQVLHWLDRPAFLAEARRVLKPAGWLVAYDHHLSPETNDDTVFTKWLRGAWVERYPPTARHHVELEQPTTWADGGFSLRRSERFRLTETWPLERLIDFLVTQSAVVSAVDERGESLEDVRAGIGESSRAWFGDAPTREFAFEGPIVCLTATGGAGAANATIEPMTAADVAAIVPLMTDFNAFEGIGWKPASMVPAFERLLADPAIGFGLVARDRATGAPVGYGLATMGYDVEYGGADAFVTELYVAPSHRGHGIGRMLLDAIVAALEARGACAVHLMVRPENEAARALYAGRGFKTVPRLLMTRSLAR